MRIDSSVIGMESARRYTSSETKISRVRIMDYKGAESEGLAGTFGGLLEMDSEQDGLSDNLQNLAKKEETENAESLKFVSLQDMQSRMSRVGRKEVCLRSRDDVVENFRQLSLRYIFRLLFGDHKTKDMFGESVESMEGDQSYDEWKEQYKAVQTGAASLSTLNSGQYMVYHHSVSFQETENTSFQAQGVVRTADGREININVSVEMSRKFTAYYEENYGMAMVQRTCDPLVINLDGGIAGLSDQKFFFDLDADGEEEEISKLESGSGYLALDKNGDGVINDGSELFGPQSGDGFKDLAFYDEDKNGWIDENDEIWSKLKIWCRDENGNDKLYTLSESGVGAIGLQNVSTDFALRNSTSANGFIRKTGIFLYENGEVGTIQHLDLAQ